MGMLDKYVEKNKYGAYTWIIKLDSIHKIYLHETNNNSIIIEFKKLGFFQEKTVLSFVSYSSSLKEGIELAFDQTFNYLKMQKGYSWSVEKKNEQLEKVLKILTEDYSIEEKPDDNRRVEQNELSKSESILLKALEFYKENKPDSAQILIELWFGQDENDKTIELVIMYLKVLMAKRSWSLNKLKENEKKAMGHIDFVNANLASRFDEKQKKLWSQLSIDFLTEFSDLVFRLKTSYEEHDDFLLQDPTFDKLKNKYFT